MPSKVRKLPIKTNLVNLFIMIVILIFAGNFVGFASLTNDPMTPLAMSFSDGSPGKCKLKNKSGVRDVTIPSTCHVRRTDDVLKYNCRTADGRAASGSMPSTVGAKIIASAIFLDFGITDAITDKHREYPAS